MSEFYRLFQAGHGVAAGRPEEPHVGLRILIIYVFLLLLVIPELSDVKDLPEYREIPSVPEVDEILACSYCGLGRPHHGVSSPDCPSEVLRHLLEAVVKGRERLLPVAKVMKRKEVMIMERNRLARNRSLLAGVNREMLEPEITRGAQSELNKGNLPLMIAVLIIIVGMCIGAFLWSGRAHGAERKFVFVAYDVSGSTDVDRINNERAVVRII